MFDDSYLKIELLKHHKIFAAMLKLLEARRLGSSAEEFDMEALLEAALREALV